MLRCVPGGVRFPASRTLWSIRTAELEDVRMAGLPQRGDRSLRAAALTQTEMAAFIWPRRALVVYLFALAFVLNILGLLLAGLPADNCTSVSDFPNLRGSDFSVRNCRDGDVYCRRRYCASHDRCSCH